MEIGPALIFVPDIVTSASFMAASECGAEQNLITWYTHAVLRPDLLPRQVWHAGRFGWLRVLQTRKLQAFLLSQFEV
jgi:hypothetical protein